MIEAQSSTPVTQSGDTLRQEFIDESVEILNSMDTELDEFRHSRMTDVDLVAAFRRYAMRIKGGASNFSFRTLTSLCMRLDDYLANAPSTLPPRAPEDLQLFIDLMLAQTEGTAPDLPTKELVRSLPHRLGFEPSEIRPRNVEVLLVMPMGAQTHYVARELSQCGYKCSVISDTIEAFGQVVETKPDLIVISALMEHLEGIDLAIALVSMPSTRNIPIAVITSLDPSDDRLALLPRRVPVVHKGPSFGDDLFSALDNLFLI